MKGTKHNNLSQRVLKFSARVTTIVEDLPDNRTGRHIASQLLRSGTSPLPNYAEACVAESKKDFIHKMKICLKEFRETYAWLSLIEETKLLPLTRIESSIDECEQLTKVFASSIMTAFKNSKSSK